MALTDDLISYWTLDEASGSRADSHSTNHLTDINTVTQEAGLINNAARFTRANTERLTSTAAALDLATTDSWSFSAWVRPTGSFSGYYTLVNDGSTGDRKAYLLLVIGTGRVWRWSGFDSGLAVADSAWSHVVYTFTSGGVNTGTERFYVNGVAGGTRTGAVPAPGAGSFVLGATGAVDHYLDGRMDEVGFWRRAITAAEVAQLYNSGAGFAYPLAVPQTVFSLGPSGSTINLADATKYHVVAEGISARPSRRRTVVPISGRDAARLVYSQAETLELAVGLYVTGATHDAFIANWREIVAQLRLAREYALDGVGSPVEFTVQWANAAAPLVYDVLDGEFPPPPALTNPVVASGQFYDAVLTLLCQPYGRAAAAAAPSDQTLTNDTTGWTPAALPGDTRARPPVCACGTARRVRP